MISALILASAYYPWLTFTRSPAFDQRVVQVEAGTLRGVGGDTQYSFRRTVRNGKSKSVWWTDTVRCPSARSVLVEVGKLKPPPVFIVGIQSDNIIVTADGVSYTMSASSQYPDAGIGDISFSSNVRTPLADWVDESLRTLDPCWSTEPPSGE